MENVSFDWNGVTAKVNGTLKHVADFKAFSDVSEEQTGNYLMVVLDPLFEGRPITVERNGADPKTAVDRTWVLRVPDKSTTFTFKEGVWTLFTLDFSETNLPTE